MAGPILRELDPDRFGYREARHLLSRAGFGGTPRQIVALQAMGLERAVDYLVDYEKVDAGYLDGPAADPDIIRPLTPAERRERAEARRTGNEQVLSKFQAMRNARKAEDRAQLRDLQSWWLGRIIATPRPLEEKLTLLWHGHFTSGHRDVEDSYLLFQQNRLFRRHANGNFAHLARAVIRDPAMIVYLNNDRNVQRKPNENLARELLELFMLGEGAYSERDIKEGARALTGYTRDDNDFRFARFAHDGGTKRILGRSGDFDGDDLVDLCLARRACSAFIAWKLYRWFVDEMSDEPDAEAKAMGRALAAELRRSKYALKPVLKRLLRSERFYQSRVMGAKIKSPVELLAGTIRALATPPRDGGRLLDAMRMMGQELFNPPNVAGWPGGKAWINTATLYTRQNLATYLITGKLPYDEAGERDRAEYDPAPLLATLKSREPDAVAEHLLASLVCVETAPQRRRELAEFFADRGRIDRDALIGGLCLITAMPEYQLC